ncbi:MAG: DUF2092 domain-containing protein [Pirellulales bacterium]
MSGPHSRPRRVARSLVVLAACSLFLLSWASLRSRPAAAAEAKVDAKAQKVIDDFSKYYAGLKGFSVKVDIDLAVEQQGKKQEVHFSQQLAAERPNKLSYVSDGAAGGGATIVSDGKDIAVYIKGFGKYAVEPAPESFDAVFKNPIVMGVLSMGNATPVTTSIVSADPAKKLVEMAESIEYGGLVDVDKTKCHLLKATGPQMDWQLWIDSGKQPLVRRFVPDLAKAFEKMAAQRGGNPQVAGLKVNNTVNYNEWQVDPKFPADAFAFKAPDDATKVDSLMEMITGGRKAVEPQPHALLGKPAPEVDLELLDGGKLNLASYKNKNVVILDFWATWCGPCVQAMPVIEKVAGKYRDKGVLLFAVNIQEMPDDIQKFLKEAELKVNVALDKDGDVARSFLANAIPQTVLVGKDGTVQVVKIGISPDLEDALSGDLESLLAGKDLAAAELAKAKARKDTAKKYTAKKPAPPEAKDDDAAGDKPSKE